ncbi:MAG: hypothetical protein A2Z09_04710 [Nitrospirae bacterium RBG_16_43_8]|nr:MAG: hypothetical protein A2Z09_04710 [Nitrospirae bacterium RBG_16_43_8]
MTGLSVFNSKIKDFFKEAESWIKPGESYEEIGENKKMSWKGGIRRGKGDKFWFQITVYFTTAFGREN